MKSAQASMNSIPEDDVLNRSAVSRLRVAGQDELCRQFMQLRPSIRGMIASRIHGKLLSRLDASDVVQETFIRASRALHAYLEDPRIHPTIWLRTLGKQVMAETVRKQYRLKRSPQLEEASLNADEIVTFLADSLESVGQSIQRAELVGQVQVLLEQISTTDRELLEMRHADGFSFQEIADMLDINVAAAKKRYYRSLERFRKQVDADPKLEAPS
ncbi:MAG: RNA polymerase sigma factor [Planctomycetaceae bacterium]